MNVLPSTAALMAAEDTGCSPERLARDLSAGTTITVPASGRNPGRTYTLQGSGLVEVVEPLPPALAEFAAAAVDRAFAHQSPSARKGGRSTRRPYVPVVVHAPTEGNPRGYTQQIMGRAYPTRQMAVEAAARYIDAGRAKLAADLARPNHRALRTQHGLPAILPGA